MTDDKFKGLVDRTRQQGAENKEAVPLTESADDAAQSKDSYSTISADRMQKVMVEFRFKNGNAVALAYSYLVKASFDPSAAILLDFSAHTVRLSGKNLAPVFAGLVSQRVAVVTEVDDLQAEAVLGEDATVVTGIEVTTAE